jgi:hypothetical protein
MERKGVLPAVLLLLGLVTLVGAVVPYPHAGQTGGYHSVERVGESRVPDDEEILAFEELSPGAQDALRRALDAPDGRSVVRGTSNLAPEFYYSGDAGYRYVRYEGEHYLFSFGGAGAGPLGVVQLGIEGLLGVLGLGCSPPVGTATGGEPRIDEIRE